MKNIIDKRSKAWRNMDEQTKKAYLSREEDEIAHQNHIASLTKPKKSEGLGDTIEKITEATGIKKLVKVLFGEDCGCDERKAKLNKLIPYSRVECLEEYEFEYLDELFGRLKNKLSPADQVRILVIYNRVFNMKQEATQCAPCWKGIMGKVRKIYDEYVKEMGDN